MLQWITKLLTMRTRIKPLSPTLLALLFSSICFADTTTTNEQLLIMMQRKTSSAENLFTHTNNNNYKQQQQNFINDTNEAVSSTCPKTKCPLISSPTLRDFSIFT